MAWYAVHYSRRLRRASGEETEPFEEYRGPYRWRWVAWFVAGGQWTQITRIMGEYYVLGARVEEAA